MSLKKVINKNDKQGNLNTIYPEKTNSVRNKYIGKMINNEMHSDIKR